MQKVDEIRLRLFLSDSDIFGYYFGDINFDRKYNSPLRKDPIPSLKFYHKDGRIYWRDFGRPDQIGSDSISFVQELFDLDRDEAINMIWKEVVEDDNFTMTAAKEFSKKEPTKFRAEFGELEDWELPFWAKAFISKPLLDFYNVKGVRAAFYGDDKIWESTPEDPAYGYVFGEDSYKTYRPLTANKKKKFRGLGNGKVLEGWDQLPKKGETLIINKSLKDCIVCRSIGILAIAPSGEGSIKYLQSKIEEINDRFKRVLIMFDDDEAGRLSSGILNEQTGWEQIFLDQEKDCYDNVTKFGNYDKLIKFFNERNIHRL